MSRSAQAAMWIIIAVGVFVLIIVLLLLNKKPTSLEAVETSFQGAIDSCVRARIEEVSDKMILQGGFVDPKNYRKYNNINAVYICENTGYYKPCIHQHPTYLSEIRKELYNHTFPNIKYCFEATISSLEGRGYTVEQGELSMNLTLSDNLIILDLEKDITLKRNEQAQTFNKLEIRIKNPLYNLARVANEIANQEAIYCYFEYIGYSILNPRFSIRRFVFSDSTEIYTITDKDSKKEMNIATRGCAIPPGI